MMSEDKLKDTGHLADLGTIGRRKSTSTKRGVLDQLGAEEVLPQILRHQVMPNDSISFLGGVYFVTRVNLVEDTVSFYIGDDLRTIPRNMVSKVQSCSVDPRAKPKRKR